MKQFFVFVFVYVCFVDVQAEIWRVNPNDTSSHFNNFFEVNSSLDVQDGDTIHLEPLKSDEPYVYSVNVRRPLVIIGNGYFLSKNRETQSLKHPSIIGVLNIEDAAAGTVVMGCSIGTITNNSSNILLLRNKIEGEIVLCEGEHSISNLSFSGNFITGNITQGDGTVNHLRFFNNFIHGSLRLEDRNTMTYFDHNTFWENFTVNSEGVNYLNNIFDCLIDESVVQNNTFEYNAFNETLLRGSVSSTNVLLVDPRQLFEDPDVNWDASFKVISGGLADGVASDGTECGMFGGSTPYVLSGLPNIPNIYLLSVPPVITRDRMTITIGVKTQE